MAQDQVSAPLDIRLFGTCELRLDGALLPPLRSRKARWLLALLILHRGQPLARDFLAGLLWPDSQERLARYSLRQRLTELRHALGEQAARLVSPSPRTLSLDLEGVFADVLAFDAAARRIDRASLMEAVGLYRGPLLEGCYEEWILPERAAREQAYLGALETLAQAAMETGTPGEAARLLRRAVLVDPLRESAHRGLMQALAADGDYAATVQVYRELRLYLHRELHAEPDPETKALYERLRAQARHQAEKESRGRKEEAASMPPSARLPRPLSNLIGRKSEVQDIALWLKTSRLVTLTGIGGVGKTRLAIAVAEEIAQEQEADVCFVGLEALTDPSVIAQAIASTLGLGEQSGRPLLEASAPGVRKQPVRPLLETLTEFLRERPLLLVLDNCEHLLPDCVRLAAALLQDCPSLRILATSRQPLGLAGERVRRVPPLALPDTPLLSGEKESASLLIEYTAVRLFVERASQAEPAFEATIQNLPVIAQVCQHLDGLPLSIEMAAARVRTLSVEQILVRLADRFHLLTGGSPAALPRQQTLRATLEWSYELLDKPERALLRRLSVFAGGWTLEAAEQICDFRFPLSDSGSDTDRIENQESKTETEDVFELLCALVDQSLVMVTEEGETGRRYRLLETVREYGLERLRESGEEERTRIRHLAYFLGWAERADAGLNGAEPLAWLARLDAEQGNLGAALEWALNSDPESAVRLAGALGRFWNLRGRWTERREALERALERGAALSVPTRAKALHWVGADELSYGDYARAQEPLQESLELFRQCGDRQQMGWVLRCLGHLAWYEGDLLAARRLHAECVGLWREWGERRGIACALYALGQLAFEEGDFRAARPYFEESLALWREIGDRVWLASTLCYLGRVARDEGDYGQARLLLEQSLQTSSEIGDALEAAQTRLHLTLLALEAGDYERATALVEQSLATWREMDCKPHVMAQGLDRLGDIALAQADYARAHDLYAECLAIVRAFGYRWGEAIFLYKLGQAALGLGDSKAARAFAEESLALSREIGYQYRVVWPLYVLGDALRAQGDEAGARACFAEGLAISRELGRHYDIREGEARLAQQIIPGRTAYIPAEDRE
jgi:predicted ATPase/DNA-binding SARP family transcriptional activator